MKKPANHLDPSPANAGDFLWFQKMTVQERAVLKVQMVHPWMSEKDILLLLKKFSVSEIRDGRLKYGSFVIKISEKLGKQIYFSYHRIKLWQKK